MNNAAPSPQRYIGRLRPSEVVVGINAALRNAKRLANDAAILFQTASFASAVSLAALAIEEVGKIQLLRRLSLVRTDAEAKSVWREIRSHKSKNGIWMLPDIASGGTVRLGQLGLVIDPDAEHAGLLDALKQIGFYSDCFGDAHWSEPSEFIDEELAQRLVGIAHALSQRSEVTVREIDLWVLHLGPVWDHVEQTREAVCRWHEAMVSESLSKRDQAEFERFMKGETVAAPWSFGEKPAT